VGKIAKKKFEGVCFLLIRHSKKSACCQKYTPTDCFFSDSQQKWLYLLWEMRQIVKTKEYCWTWYYCSTIAIIIIFLFLCT